MKLLSFSIILSSLLIYFQFAWTNRLEFKNADLKTKSALKGYTVIFNKWISNHCFFCDERLPRRLKCWGTSYSSQSL